MDTIQGPRGKNCAVNRPRSTPCRKSGSGRRKGANSDGRYSIIIERIIAKLEHGTVPWHKPSRSVGPARNLVSKKLYSGINVWLLTAQGYTSPYWATIRQINKLGGQVRKEEKSTLVVYVDRVEVKTNGDEQEPEREQVCIRHTRVLLSTAEPLVMLRIT